MAVVLVVKGHLLGLKSLVEKKGDISRMKKQKRTSLALLLGSVMALSMVSTPVQAEEIITPSDPATVTASEPREQTSQVVMPEGTYEPGVTVIQDAESKTGYTANFVLDVEGTRERTGVPEGAVITGVELHGSFRLISDPDRVSLAEDSDHSLYDYENGDFVANVHPYQRASGQTGNRGGEWTFEMGLNEQTGNYEISVPMVSGGHYYYYVIQYTLNGEADSVQTDDPANPSGPRRNEENSDSETSDITHSIVYGHWDPEKQSLSPNLDYMNPYDGKRGTVQYVEYAGTISEHQDLGIYLPAGYDADREEPYRVIYLTHGMGGNETYWFTQPQASNIMDHIVAEDPGQEAIIVAMDNTLYNWDYYQIGLNVTERIIPYIEAHYNVSTDPQDRAFAGFSMGAMTSTYMAFHYADEFGYFGIFSGTNIGNATFAEDFAYDGSLLQNRVDQTIALAYLQEVYENIVPSEDLLNAVVFTMAGNVDTAVYANGFAPYGAYETIRDWCQEYMPEENFIDGGLVPGSHDIYTWAQCFHTFAGEVCWSKNTAPEEPETPVDPEIPTDPEQPGEGPDVDVETPQDTQPSTDQPDTTSPVQTGDQVQPLWYAAGAGLAAAALLGFAIKKKKSLISK